MDNSSENVNESSKTSGSRSRFTSDTRKQVLMTIIAGLVLLAAVWIWKSIEIRNINKQASTEKNKLFEYATNQIRQTHEMHLKTLAKPLVWAIRTEVLNHDLRQVNLYANEMVQENNFQKVTIADANGRVITSTNKKEEGKEFASIGNATYLIANKTMVNYVNDTLLVLSSPIMGFNNRLGTIIINYAFHPLVLK